MSAKAAALRSGMLDGIGSEDISEVVAKITEKAKQGDLKAAAILLSLLGVGK